MYQKIALAIIAIFIFSYGTIKTPQSALAMPSAGAPADARSITGTVIETINASGYTYMLVEANSRQNWVAIPATTVLKGSQVSYIEGMTMSNFTSKTLNRTFDSIIFSSGLAEQAVQTKEAPADDSFEAALSAEKDTIQKAPEMTVSGGSSVAIIPLQEISVEKSTAENGYSVEEIFAKAEELNSKTVRIQGKVVKFSPNIMGKHWVHLQDGTGNPMKNTHDLVVTTGEPVEVNSTITMEGVVAADKDFGAGYKYAVIVEEASVIK